MRRPSTSPNGTIPKSRSLAHDKFKAKKAVFVSFDIETGGEYCGILQMYAEIVRVDVLPTILKKGTHQIKTQQSTYAREATSGSYNTAMPVG